MLMAELQSTVKIATQDPNKNYSIHLLGLKDTVRHLLPSFFARGKRFRRMANLGKYPPQLTLRLKH